MTIMGQHSNRKGTRQSGVSKESSFIGDVLRLMTGTVGAQSLTIIVAPILARLYPPKELGIAAIFISISGILSAISCVRYEFAIMLPERDEEAVNLLGVSIVLVLLISLLSALIVPLVTTPVTRLLNSPELSYYLWLLPLVIVVEGGQLALKYWNIRIKCFGRLGIAHLSQSLIVNGTRLGVGALIQANATTLIGAKVVGVTAVTTALGWRLWKEDRELLMRNVRWHRMIAGLKRYRKFPIFDIWCVLLNRVSTQLPRLLLAGFFNPTVVGYLAIGLHAIQLPMTLLGRTIGQVLFQRAAEAGVKGNLSQIAENVFERLISFGLFPTLALAIIGGDFFRVVFGERWVEAGVYVQILSLFIFLRFISSPMSVLLRVLELQHIALLLNCIIFITRLVSLVIGGYMGSPRLALALLSASGVFIYGWYALYILKLAGVMWHQSASILFRHALCVTPGIMLILILRIGDVSSTLLVIISVILVMMHEVFIMFRDPKLMRWLANRL